MSGTPPRPRLAVIGISGYGKIHLELARACRDRGEADLVAAVVINPDEEAANVAELRAHGCAIYATHEEMLRRHAGQIDVCLIPTGIHWHVRMTLAALRAGANVLVEKPLAGSLDGIAAVQEFVDPVAPDDGDLDRPANVLVPEADFERARQLFFTEREDEL